MKKYFVILFSILFICILAIPAAAIIYPSDEIQIQPKPWNVIDNGENGNYKNGSFGYYYSYANIVQYIFDNRTSTAYPVGSLKGNWKTSIAFHTPNILFANWSGAEAWNGNQFLGEFSGYYQSDSASSPSAIFIPSGNQYMYNLWTVYPTSGATKSVGVTPYSTESFVSLYSGCAVGERNNNGYVVDGISIYASKAINLSASVIGRLVYLNDSNQVVERVIDDQYELTGNTFIPNPYYLDDNANFTSYYFEGYFYLSSDVTTTFAMTLSYDATYQRYVDLFDGDLMSQDLLTDMPFNIDPISRVYSDINLSQVSEPIYPEYNISITKNGTYEFNGTYDGGKIIVDVPTVPIITPDDPISPGEVLYIEDNGFYDVTQYNYVDVDIPTEIIEQQGVMQWLYDAVEGFLTLEFAPDFSIGGILLFAVGFALIMWIIKIFLGG